MRSMKSWSRLFTACLALASAGALAAPTLPPEQGKLRRAPRAVKDEYLVVLKEKPARGLVSVAVRADALARQYGARVLTTHETAFRGFLVSASEAQARALAEDPLVDYIEENAIIQAAGLQSPAPWNLDRIDQERLPLSNSYRTDDATDINVYVIDTGLRTSHEEFEGRAQVVFNAIPNDFGDDLVGHGTAVAAIIGGKTFGVAKKVRVNAVKASGMNGATTDTLVQALEWVATHAVTPAIVNLSLTASNKDETVDDAVDAALQNPGLVLVNAAGNAGIDACTVSPAHLQPDADHPYRERLLTVGAIDEAYTPWMLDPFVRSNWGPCLDLWAPGANIPSAGYLSDTDISSFEGTSFAAPHVSGVAAILLSQGVSPADIPARLLEDAAVGQVWLDPSDEAPSPNRLLFKRPHAVPLVNGVATSVSDATGGNKYFKLEVPPGRPSVVFSIAGGTGDADLYVQYDQLPETYVYQCRPLRKGNNETCTLPSPRSGTWYVLLHAYSTYSTTLKGQY